MGIEGGERIIDNIWRNKEKVNSFSFSEFLNAESERMRVFLLINGETMHFLTYLYFFFSAENDFFLKLSGRKNQKRQQNEQLYTESPEKIQTSCSPPEFATSMQYSFFLQSCRFKLFFSQLSRHILITKKKKKF